MAAPDMGLFLAGISVGSVVTFVVSVAAGLASVYALGRGVCLCLKMMTDVDICGGESLAKDAGDTAGPGERKPASPAGAKVKSGGSSWTKHFGC